MRKYELKEVEKIVEDIKTLKLEDNEHLQAIQKINSQIEYIRKEWEQLQLDEQRMLYVSNKFKTESTKYGELLNLLPKANAKLPTESGKKTKDNKMDEWQSHIANLILIHKTLLDEMNQYERAINATLEVEVILKKEIKKANEVIKEYIDLIDMGNNMANNSGSI